MNKHSLTLFRQQFASHYKTILLWTVVWSLLALLFVSVFNDLSKTAAQSIRLYQSLPPAILNTFNISSDYLTKSEKFLSGQFLTIYLLAGGVFSVFIGVGSVGGKLDNATIATFLTKPISRVSFYITELLTSAATMLTVSATVGIIMYGLFATLANQPSVSAQYFVAAFLGSGCLFVTLAIFGQALGTLLNRTHAQAVGAALVVFSFFVNGLGSLAGVPAWLQKVSIFYYLDTTQIRDLYSLNGGRLWVLGVVSLVFLVIGTLWFRRKDIYI